jgi:hypothetical protein
MEGLEKTEKTGSIRLNPASWILVICLAVSFTSLILYLIDLNYSDKVLIILLAILRYSSFFLCICSFYMLVLNLYRVFHKRSVLVFMRIFLYIVLIGCSLSIFFFEAFITVIAGGNG